MKQIKTLLIAALCGVCGGAMAQTPENLYIIGGPFNPNRAGNWVFRDIVPLEKDATNPAVFYYRGYIGYNTFGDEPGNFKILNNNNAWTGYHPDIADNGTVQIGASVVGQALKMRLDGADSKWCIPEDRSGDGYYSIKIDTEALTFTVESFTAASCPDIPVGIFLIGGPWIDTDYNWGNVECTYRMERDDEDPYVFHFRDYMERNQWGTDPGNFKILINKRAWGNELHPGDDTQDVVLTSYAIGTAQTITNQTKSPGDKKWILPEDGSGNGYWDFTVDVKDLTFTVNQFVQDLDYFKEMYLYGDAFNGWGDPSVAEVLTSSERGVYTWTGTAKAGTFKVNRTKSAFKGAYVALEADKQLVLGEAVPVTYEKNYAHEGAVEAGKANDYKFVISADAAGKEVTLTLNLNNNTITLAEAGENPGTGVEAVEAQLATVYVQGGQLFIDGMAGTDYTASVYSLDGREVNRTAFTGNAAITLPQGSYVLTLTPAAGQPQTVKVAL